MNEYMEKQAEKIIDSIEPLDLRSKVRIEVLGKKGSSLALKIAVTDLRGKELIVRDTMYVIAGDTVEVEDWSTTVQRLQDEGMDLK